jgi:GTP pyrophosphokinase
MLLAMVDDVRVVVVKLADRLHNMRTLHFLESESQQRIARETLDIYAPIAHRLGMGRIRGELEDSAFSYLESASCLELQKRVASKSKAHDKFLHGVQEIIRKKLVEAGVPAEVEGRIKRLYSIHQKLARAQRSLDQIYDLLAIRVITDTVRNCYAALGVIHQVWRPVPGRFKDYIAMPRPNLYQSLHTTVLHQGQPFEVQIRTQEMHIIAEQGVAAHWKYKDGKEVAEADDQRILWMRQLIEWVKEMQEPSEFLSTLKIDLYPEEVYTFTPKGKVIVLPRGATPVDFAYAVHTEVGHAAPAPRSTARWCRCATKSPMVTSWRSSPRRATCPTATGSLSCAPRALAARFDTGSISTSASRPPKSAAAWWRRKRGNSASASRK